MPKSFQNSQVIETRLPDFRNMCLTVMKIFYNKQKPYIIQYRSYKKFSNDGIANDLQNTCAYGKKIC